MRSAGSILVWLVVALVLTACGGGTSGATNDYVQAINSAQQRLVKDVGPVSADADGKISIPVAKRQLDRITSGYDRLAGTLRTIDPPQEVSGDHRRLITLVSDYSGLLTRSRASLDAADPSKQLNALKAVQARNETFGPDFDRTVAAINSKLGLKEAK